MDKYSYVGNGDVNALEDLYNQYRNDPESVDFGWKKEAIPVTREKKSLIAMLFDAMFN